MGVFQSLKDGLRTVCTIVTRYTYSVKDLNFECLVPECVLTWRDLLEVELYHFILFFFLFLISIFSINKPLSVVKSLEEEFTWTT